MTESASKYMIDQELSFLLIGLKMIKPKNVLLPFGAGMAGGLFLLALYIGILSIAESPQHAIDFFGQDRWIVIPIILGFAVQVGLYVILKKRFFVPVANTGHSAALTGASGTTSTVAMVACCAHHVTDILPFLGLTAAAAFLAQYRIIFMIVGFGMTFVGITIMLVILINERRRVINSATIPSTMETA